MLFLVCLFTYVVFFVLSPDPAVQICGKNCTPEAIDQIRANLGLNRSSRPRSGRSSSGLFVGRTYGTGANLIDCAAPCLGYSFQSSQPVTDMILQRLPVSATVAIGAAVLWLLAGVWAGLVSAVREGRFTDRFITGLTLTGMSVPDCVLGLSLQFLLVVHARLAPVPRTRWRSARDPLQSFRRTSSCPWIVLSIRRRGRLHATHPRERHRDASERTTCAPPARRACAPTWSGAGTRCARPSARSSRSSEWTSPRCSAAPSSPETVFGLNGVGKLAADSITKNDQPVIMGVTLLAAFLVVVGNMVVDLLYTTIDPRVRVGSTA